MKNLTDILDALSLISKDGAKIAEAVETVAIMDELRERPGYSVEIMCDDEDPERAERQCAVEVTAEWTGWSERRFYGRTVLDALRAAVEEARGHA